MTAQFFDALSRVVGLYGPASEGGPYNDEEKEPEQARGKEKASASESAR